MFYNGYLFRRFVLVFEPAFTTDCCAMVEKVSFGAAQAVKRLRIV